MIIENMVSFDVGISMSKGQRKKTVSAYPLQAHVDGPFTDLNSR